MELLFKKNCGKKTEGKTILIKIFVIIKNKKKKEYWLLNKKMIVKNQIMKKRKKNIKEPTKQYKDIIKKQED